MDAHARDSAPHALNRGCILLAAAVLLFVLLIVGIPVYLAYQSSQVPIVGHNCGTVTAGLGLLRGSAGDGDPWLVEDCLLQAYTHCAPATLVEDERGIDFSYQRSFVVEPGTGHCAATMTTVGQPSPLFGFSSKSSERCLGVQQDANGITIVGCAPDGDIGVARYPAQIGTYCGYAAVHGPASALPSDVAVERCFWQPGARCHAATLTFGISDPNFPNNFVRERYVTIEPVNDTCLITVVTQPPLVQSQMPNLYQISICAGIQPIGQWLVLRGCGATGQDIDLSATLSPATPTPSPTAPTPTPTP